MRKENTDPESLDRINSLEITPEVESFVNNLYSRIMEEKTARAFWERNIDRWRNLRYGIRAPKTFPWKDAANYVFPLIDYDISRLKPAYADLINITPVVSYSPYGEEDIDPARKREQLFDWLLKTKGSFYENYLLGIDYLLEQGMVVFKTSWRYSTRTYTVEIDLKDLDEQVLNAIYDPRVNDELLFKIIVEEYRLDTSFDENIKEIRKAVDKFRAGKTELSITLLEKKDDYAEIIPCSVRDEVTFPIGTTDLNEARFIDYVFCMSKNDIKIAMNDNKYNKYSDEEIESWSEYNTYNLDKRLGKNFQYLDKYNDVIWMHETCIWRDVNGDGIEERCIVTWPDASPKSVLRLIELPYEHGQWPYVLVRREINDSGPYSSRGIPALQEDFQNGISTSFNQSVDNGAIINAPQIVTRQGAVSNIRNLRYIPGNVVVTNGPTSDYEIRQGVNASQGALFSQAQYLKSWADQRTGNLTSGLSQANNLPGTNDGKKTAKEISTVEILSTQATSLDLFVFQIQMAKVYYQADALYEQFMEENEFSFITNDAPVKISRSEIQGKFNIVPNGKIDNTNPQMRINKSWMMLRAFLNDPDIKQRELKKLFLDDMDVKLSMRLFKSDEEIAQEQQQAQQNMVQQMQIQDQIQNQQIRKQLETKSITDDLEVRKAALMAPIDGKKYAAG